MAVNRRTKFDSGGFESVVLLQRYDDAVPLEVKAEIDQFSRDYDMGQDSIMGFDMVEMEEDYPLIAQHIKDYHYKNVYIHYYW